jgi:hypothetical protein
MNPSEEFRRHAAECQQMAKFTRDPASKATWSRMAERWLRCADAFQRQHPALPPARRRSPAGRQRPALAG